MPFSLASIRDSAYAAEGRIRIEENPDKTGNTYVYNSFTAEDLSFTHPYESDHYYSYADFDIVVVNAGSEGELPILRLWITLFTQRISPDISSLTFTVGGQEYTFSDLLENDSVTQMNGESKQTILIRFDRASLEFLEDLAYNYLTGTDSFQVVFHGTEEIEAELGDHFWDVFAIYWSQYLNSNAADWLGNYDGTPMTIRRTD